MSYFSSVFLLGFIIEVYTILDEFYFYPPSCGVVAKLWFVNVLLIWNWKYFMIILWFWRESYHSVSAGQAPYFLPSGKSPCTTYYVVLWSIPPTRRRPDAAPTPTGRRANAGRTPRRRHRDAAPTPTGRRADADRTPRRRRHHPPTLTSRRERPELRNYPTTRWIEIKVHW